MEGKVGVLLYHEGHTSICKGMEMALKCMIHSVDLEPVTKGLVLFSFFYNTLSLYVTMSLLEHTL